METTRKHYDTPEVTEHGAAIDTTRGDCTCKTEECGFKPATDDGLGSTN
jgi:hypothetical protein